MKSTDRFTDITEVNAELLRLDAERDAHAERLEDLFSALKQSHVRKSLMKNSVKSAFGSFGPGKILGSLVSVGGMGGGLSMALGAGKGGLIKRMGLFALGLAAPKVMEKVESISFPDIAHEVGISWGRLKDHMQLRRDERKFRKAQEEKEEL